MYQSRFTEAADMDVLRFCIYHFVHSPFPTMAVVEEREGSDVSPLSNMRPPNSDTMWILLLLQSSQDQEA